jgi:hypothetical protein
MGSRKYDFTQEIADIICDRLMGGESLRAICRDEEMPDKSTVLKWLIRIPGFDVQYARAREVQADGMVDEMLDISDDSQNDWMTKRGLQVPDNEAIQRSKLRIDTRRWVASKMRPKKYGDKFGADAPAEGEENITRVVGGFAEAFKPE